MATCHNVPPVKSDYIPVGITEKMIGIDVYVSKPKNNSNPFKKAIIVSFDIFGFHPNTKQFCDLLADAGFLTLLPDYFHGRPPNPSLGVQAMIKYIAENFPTESLLKDALNIVKHLHKEFGVKNFGFAGFCWGGILGSRVCAVSDFDACVLIHYAPITPPDIFKHSQCPIAFLPSSGDPDSQPFIDSMKDKPFAKKNFQKRFNDMNHGFAASRGDLNNPLIATRVNEVIKISVDFFRDNLGVKC